MNSIRYTKNKPNQVLLSEEAMEYRHGPIDEIIYADGQIVDPTLDNNSWAVVRIVCERGDAANYWSLGDEKMVTKGDYTRPVKLVHMGEIYGNKNAVFQFWNRTESNYVWDEGNSNAIISADIWDDIEPTGAAFAELVSDELAAQLREVTVQAAASGTDATLVDITGKLFLPAEKELTKTRVYSVAEEFAALTTFGYYSEHDTNEARIKHKASAPTATSGQAWWERSPLSGNTDGVCLVNSDGSLLGNSASSTNCGVAPCFAF